MFAAVQAGSSLQIVKTDGTVQTLTLPAGVTIDATLNGIFAILSQYLFFVGASTVNLWIDPLDFSVRAMNILPPNGPPTIAAGSGSGLTGAYKGAYSFAVKNAAGLVLNESPLSPTSLPVTLANKNRDWTALGISPNPDVNCRRLYVTAAGGSILFRAFDLDDNSSVEAIENVSDSALSLLPANPDIGIIAGTIPGTGLQAFVEWKNILWAVSSVLGERDIVRYTDPNSFFTWSADNSIKAPPVGEDTFGVIGFIRRRDALGILKRSRLLKIVGTSSADFQVVIVAERISGVAPRSIIVIKDKGYFLGLDGVYRWDDDGVVRISEAQVDPWFTTDTYFNRARFPNAFSAWNPRTNALEIHLASAGSNTEDVWISYAIDQQEWLGPHTTAAFIPTAADLLEDASDAQLPAIGASDGYLYLQNRATLSDVSGASVTSAINAFFQTKFHSGKTPDITHFWGQLSVLSRIETGGTLLVTPYVGRLDASAGTVRSFDLTKGRQRGDRLGVGPLCSLKFAINTASRGFLVYAYEINPVFEVGRR